MSKKSKKRTEEKVPLKEKPAAVTASRKETKDEKKAGTKCIIPLLYWSIVRDSLDALFKEAKEKKVQNDEKREKEAAKEARKEKKRKQMEFEAINSMKAVNGGWIVSVEWTLDPIGYDEESGLKVHRVDQLNLGKRANTPPCPFDCDCCY